jgi:hypothetical protein
MTGAGAPFYSLPWGGLYSRYHAAVESLRDGQVEGLEDALWFLQRRPRFHGSGYLTERALKYIDRVALTPHQRAAVVAAAEAIAVEGYTRESWKALNLLVRLDVPGAAEARAGAHRKLIRYRGY